MEYVKTVEKNSGRRSINNKNLEHEVELICSQDESDEDYNTNAETKEIFCRTPSRSKRTNQVATPSVSHNVLQEIHQTPRRSCRKSIKPPQDYEDIVSNSLSISTRSAKKQILAENDEQNENGNAETLQPKWTPAKVGRVSQKRKRKSKRALKGINEIDAATMLLDERSLCHDAESEEPTECLDTTKQYVEEIFEVKEKVNQIEHSSKQDDINVKINEKPQHIVNEVTNDGNKKLIEQDFGNANNKNMTMEYNNCQGPEEKGMQPEADETDADSKYSTETENYKDSEKLENEEIRIVYESNISNTDLKEESETNAIEDEQKESFGCYLKSQVINISDLGLNPLKDEEEEKEVSQCQTKPLTEETEEMPSLIVCDDDENAEAFENFSETNYANDSVIVVGAIDGGILKHNEEIMESLQMSDDGGETPKKRICVDLTDISLLDISTVVTPKRIAKRVGLPSVTSNILVTPKQKIKPYRFPTPYRAKNNYKFNEKENFVNDSNKRVINDSVISITTLEPKEIVLRGIRKRSLSLCVDGNAEKRKEFLSGPPEKVRQGLMVSFYSPANQTTYTDDLDVIVKQRVKNQNPQEKNLVNNFVTTRRKRSLSLDESKLISKLPRPVVSQSITSTKTSSSPSKPISRTKLPDFAAIHQKQFKKMENLVEHVNRKQERSKNLINSATKIKTASSQKNASIMKDVNNTKNIKSTVTKKLDLPLPPKNKILNTATAQPKVAETGTVKNIPHARVAVVNPIKSVSISQNIPQRHQQIDNSLKPSQITNTEKPRLNSKPVVRSKPAFNLSTSLVVKPSPSNFVGKANASHMTTDDKMASRLQHHMDMFKGRVASARAGTASRRNEVILKGVRSNRRFELQMQHRRNVEQ